MKVYLNTILYTKYENLELCGFGEEYIFKIFALHIELFRFQQKLSVAHRALGQFFFDFLTELSFNI